MDSQWWRETYLLLLLRVGERVSAAIQHSDISFAKNEVNSQGRRATYLLLLLCIGERVSASHPPQSLKKTQTPCKLPTYLLRLRKQVTNAARQHSLPEGDVGEVFFGREVVYVGGVGGEVGGEAAHGRVSECGKWWVEEW